MKKKRTGEILDELNEKYIKVEDLDSLLKGTDIYVYQKIETSILTRQDTLTQITDCKVITLENIEYVGKYDVNKGNIILIEDKKEPLLLQQIISDNYGTFECKIDIYIKKTDVKAEKKEEEFLNGLGYLRGGKRRKSRRNRKSKKGKKSRKARKSRRKSNRRR
jgi:predicted RNase H-like nuclease (RuvC/YqgF family)